MCRKEKECKKELKTVEELDPTGRPENIHITNAVPLLIASFQQTCVETAEKKTNQSKHNPSAKCMIKSNLFY